jgi:hypothetical protein
MGTDPFQPDEPVELEQIDRKRFLLMRGFSYTDPDGERHHVTPEGVGKTDLASLPSILWWFVASYGRQTRAALVHDQLIDQIERHDADWVFRRALADSGIGCAAVARLVGRQLRDNLPHCLATNRPGEDGDTRPTSRPGRCSTAERDAPPAEKGRRAQAAARPCRYGARLRAGWRPRRCSARVGLFRS